MKSMTWGEYIERAKKLSGLYAILRDVWSASYWRAAAMSDKEWPSEHLQAEMGSQFCVDELCREEERALGITAARLLTDTPLRMRAAAMLMGA